MIYFFTDEPKTLKMAREKFFLQHLMNCDNGGSAFCSDGLEWFRLASLSRNDKLHECLSTNSTATYRCLKNCIATYTSKHQVKSSAIPQCDATVHSTEKTSALKSTAYFVVKHVYPWTHATQIDGEE